MEAAGLVLGVLPLLVVAAEKWDYVLSPIKRYKKFVPELKIFECKLNTQRVIFRNECTILLRGLADRETISNMLQTSVDPHWNNPNLDQKLSRVLGESGKSCEDIVHSIKLTLDTLDQKVASWTSTLQSVPYLAVGDKAWVSRVVKKLKFSLSQSRLDISLNELRTLIEDFRTLTAQTCKLKATTSFTDSFQLLPDARRRVQRYRAIKDASTHLYDAMNRACQLCKADHLACFCLGQIHVEESTTNNIRFNLAFTHLPRESSVSRPVWISIESAIDDTVQAASHSHGNVSAEGSLPEAPERSLKRATLENQTTVKKKTKTSRVRFASCEPRETLLTISTPQLPLSMLPVHCIRRDFCLRIQHSGKGPENGYIGFFERNGPYSHRLYYCAPTLGCESSKPTTLNELFCYILKNGQEKCLLKHERIRLASRLAVAALQFHSTPLLNGSWRSQDIIFFDDEDCLIQQNRIRGSPHLRVPVMGDQSNQEY